MKKIFLLLIVGFIACKSNSTSNNDNNTIVKKDSLKSLSENNSDIINYFSNYKNIYKFNDSINASELATTDLLLMDTVLLKKYKLVAIQNKHETGAEICHYKDAACKIIAYYKSDKYCLLALTYFTVSAGDGSPILQLSTFNNDGILLNKKEFEIESWQGPEYHPTQYLIIKNINGFEFVTSSIIRVFKDEEMSILVSEKHKIKKDVFEIKEGMIKQLK